MGARSSASFLGYLRAQFDLGHCDSPQAVKHERVYNFLSVPEKLEQFIVLGYFVCLDSFLYHFTILPLRILVSALLLLLYPVVAWRGRPRPAWSDLARGLMVLLAGYGLQMVDSSRLYHSIRGQSTLKLYVIYNVLEVADKLCCSFGLDILDSLFSRRPGAGVPCLRPLPHFLLAVTYLFVHTVILFYQVISLNVAINSYSQALLTLLVSNQFVEIKSAVFKKFEKENLFQLACADVVERFQLTLYLIIIGLRNVSEMRHSLDPGAFLDRLLLPLAIVFLSEILVDWLKHAFITKFNHIHPDVYVRFCQYLAKDFATLQCDNSLSDKSPQVARRIGFAVFPLACLLLRVLIQVVQSYSPAWTALAPHLLGCYLSLVLLKVLLGINIAGYCGRKNRAPQLVISKTTLTPSLSQEQMQ